MVQRSRVYVIGVGMTKFEKPGRRENFDYPQMAVEAVSKALEDSRLNIGDIKQACVGYVYGDSTCGQRALYEVGMTGIPIFNVNNNCSTGSSALLLAKQIVESNNADCALALGFEKMERGSLMSKFLDRTNPMEKHVEKMADIAGLDSAPIAPQLFGNAGKEHMSKYGTTQEVFAKIAYKNHKHSVNNPYSQFQEEYTLDQIINSPTVFGPLTKLQCCPTSDGAAAAILASEDFVFRHGLQAQAVEIIGMEMATDLPSTFAEESCMKIVGYDMTKAAAEKLFSQTPYKPTDVDVVELHDCFSANELITYEALGLCPPGKGGDLVNSGGNTYGGKYVVNPSGGLISKGHPLGATGIAQCAELCWQLRGLAGKRQVPNARLALQHNIGLGGAVVVALYRLGFPGTSRSSVRAQMAAAIEDPSVFKVKKAFDLLKEAMEEDQDNLIDKVRGIYCFKVKNSDGKEGMWIINAKTGKGNVTYNGKEKPDVTIIVHDDDVVDLLSGKLNPQKAFFQGKIKIQGNMGLALKLTELQKKASAKIEVLRAKLKKAADTRTFGRFGMRRRIVFALLPIMYKMGVITTLLVGLTVFTLKGLTIGVVLLFLTLTSTIHKLKYGWSYGAHTAAAAPAKSVHIHIHSGGGGPGLGFEHAQYGQSVHAGGGDWERHALPPFSGPDIQYHHPTTDGFRPTTAGSSSYYYH